MLLAYLVSKWKIFGMSNIFIQVGVVPRLLTPDQKDSNLYLPSQENLTLSEADEPGFLESFLTED